MCYFVSVSAFTAYIIFTFRVRVSVRVRVKVRVLRVMVRVSSSVRLQCCLANKVLVRCLYQSGEYRDHNYLPDRPANNISLFPLPRRLCFRRQ